MKKKSEKKALAVFLLPGLTGFFIFYIIPFAAGIYYTLIESNFTKKLVGLANFIRIFKNDVFLLAMKNTFIMTGISVPLILIISLFLASALKRLDKKAGIFKSALFMPIMIPAASLVLVWSLFFSDNGYINYLLESAGFSPVAWKSSGAVRIPVIILYLWKNAGYNTIIFIAGLLSIPKELYEAADIDGAGRWVKLRYITIPLLFPTTFFVTIMSIVNSFKMFKETYLLYGAYPDKSIYMLQHFMNNNFVNLNYQNLTTAAYIFAGIVYILVFLLYRAENKMSRDLW